MSIIYANKKDYYEILEQMTKLENNLNFDFTADKVAFRSSK
ncbi:hypothetical protein [Campylobacter concisus]|nr:hypothetical protein [Campylobacter concisus]